MSRCAELASNAFKFARRELQRGVDSAGQLLLRVERAVQRIDSNLTEAELPPEEPASEEGPLRLQQLLLGMVVVQDMLQKEHKLLEAARGAAGLETPPGRLGDMRTVLEARPFTDERLLEDLVQRAKRFASRLGHETPP